MSDDKKFNEIAGIEKPPVDAKIVLYCMKGSLIQELIRPVFCEKVLADNNRLLKFDILIN